VGECDVGTTGEDTAGDLRGQAAAAAAAAPVSGVQPMARSVIPATAPQEPAPGFVALLEAPPPPPPSQAPGTAALAAQAPAARAAPALPSQATAGRRSAAAAASAGAGAAAVAATPVHTRDVPVRASAAVALVRAHFNRQKPKWHDQPTAAPQAR
jgi:hypothetical protein